MKTILMVLAVIMTLGATSNAFAISDDELIAKCMEAGKYKLNLYAQAYGCEIVDVEADSIDNRWYAPSYVWYVGIIPCANNLELTKMVQYSDGQCR